MTGEEKIWKLIEGFRQCMLVTQSGGALRARPMTPIVRKDEKRIYFLAHRAGLKDDEIAAAPAVNLSFDDGGKVQVSVSGAAAISYDTDLKTRLWGPFSQAFLPEGPMSDETIALVVTPDEGEYWDGDGTVVSLVKIGAALIRGQEPDVGDSAKARL